MSRAHSVRLAAATIAATVIALLAARTESAYAQRKSAETSSCVKSASADACYKSGLELASTAYCTHDCPTYKDSAVVRANRTLARGRLREACDRGVAESCTVFGRLVSIPEPGASDSVSWAALHLASLSYRKGCYLTPLSAAACNSLGDTFAFGLGTNIDRDSAFSAFQRGCRAGNATACFRWDGRLPEHPEYGPDRKKLGEPIAKQSCEGGSPTGCVNLAIYRQTDIESIADTVRRRKAFAAEAPKFLAEFKNGCKAMIVASCTQLAGDELSETWIPVRDVAASKDYYERACRGRPGPYGPPSNTETWLGDGTACTVLGRAALYGTPADTAAALVYFNHGCLLFDDASCGYLSYVKYLTDKRNPYGALMPAAASCLETSATTGCDLAGWILSQTGADDAQEALRYYSLACERLDVFACLRSVGLAAKMHDPSLTMKYARIACLHAVPSSNHTTANGCDDEAELLDGTFGFPDKALPLREKSCDLGDAYGCFVAMQLHRKFGHEVEAGLYRARACKLEGSYCKRSSS